MNVPWKKDETPEYVKAEKRQANRPGARPQLNSGRTWSGLRDVIERSPIGVLLIDNKTGRYGPLKSFRVSEAEWETMRRDANRTPPGCHPILRVDCGKYKLMVIDENTWDLAMGMIGYDHAKD
jgi:hypothetical protein